MTPNLLNAIMMTAVGSAVAAASNTDSDSTIIDMAGYEGVVFLTDITDSVATGVATMTVEQNDSNSGSGMAALSGAVATLTSAANDDLNGQFLAVDVHQPKERYLRVNRASATANIAYGSVYAIRYGAKKLPIDFTDIANAVVVSGPSES